MRLCDVSDNLRFSEAPLSCIVLYCIVVHPYLRRSAIWLIAIMSVISLGWFVSGWSRALVLLPEAGLCGRPFRVLLIVWQRRDCKVSIKTIIKIHSIWGCQKSDCRGSRGLCFNGASSDLSRNSVAIVRDRTFPAERPLIVGEVSANFCGYRGAAWSVRRIPHSRNFGFLDRTSLELSNKLFH
jgi:hypothetical protein